jgi:hypothetical protein
MPDFETQNGNHGKQRRGVFVKLINLFRERLGVRLTVMFLAAALVPLLVVGLLSYQRASTSLKDLALDNVEQEAQLVLCQSWING